MSQRDAVHRRTKESGIDFIPFHSIKLVAVIVTLVIVSLLGVFFRLIFFRPIFFLAGGTVDANLCLFLAEVCYIGTLSRFIDEFFAL